MKMLDVKLSKEINTSAEKVWDILGTNFLTISEWGGGILSSVRNPNVPVNFEGAPAGGRVCDVKGLGKINETILHFSNDKREITWSAESPKIPGFVKGLQNAFYIEDLGGNKCKVTSNLTAKLKGIGGLLLKGKMEKDFEKTIGFFLDDLKIYAETDEVSQKKKKEIEKSKK